jgi:hypothetical protein
MAWKHITELRDENKNLKAEKTHRERESMSELERTKAELAEARTANETLQLSTLRNSVAISKGLPASAIKFLEGKDQREMEANADELLRLMGGAAKRPPPPDFGNGARPPAGGDISTRCFDALRVALLFPPPCLGVIAPLAGRDMPYNTLVQRPDVASRIPTEHQQHDADDPRGLVSGAEVRDPDSDAERRHNLSVLSALPVACWVTGDTGMKQTTTAVGVQDDRDRRARGSSSRFRRTSWDDIDFDLWGALRPLMEAAIARAGRLRRLPGYQQAG